MAFVPLSRVEYGEEAGPGRWLQVDQELQSKNGMTVGTRNPTGHSVLVDLRFELPYGESPLLFSPCAKRPEGLGGQGE